MTFMMSLWHKLNAVVYFFKARCLVWDDLTFWHLWAGLLPSIKMSCADEGGTLIFYVQIKAPCNAPVVYSALEGKNKRRQNRNLVKQKCIWPPALILLDDYCSHYNHVGARNNCLKKCFFLTQNYRLNRNSSTHEKCLTLKTWQHRHNLSQTKCSN